VSVLNGTDDISLTLIQATGLLLPVVFLTLRFYLEDARGRAPESQIDKTSKRFVLMIFTLTISGFCATVALFESGFKTFLGIIAVLGLAVFFLLYGWTLYGTVIVRRRYNFKSI